MPICRWLYAIAFGIALLAAASAFAQPETGKATEQGKVAIQQSPPDMPLPQIRIMVIEDKTKAKVRELRENEADQREKDGLVAQQGMNIAAQKMADYSLYQTILVGIGTVLLLATLFLTIMANRAAFIAAKAGEQAVEVTRIASQRQLRAYVFPAVAKIEGIENGAVNLKLGFKNSGQTPAYAIRLRTRRMLAPPTTTDFQFDNADIKRIADFGPGQGQTITIPVEPAHFLEHRRQIESGEFSFFVCGDVRYNDAFGNERTTMFRFQLFTGEGVRSRNLDVCDEGNNTT